jgi:hypothetical protein
MKKISLFMLFALLSVLVFGQRTVSINDYNETEAKEKVNDQQIETLMSSFQLKRISGFGGPTMTFTTVNDEFVTMVGGGGGVLINNLFLGGYGESMSHDINKAHNLKVRNVNFGHGGFWVGYEIAPHKVIHPVISSRIGWGNISGTTLNENNYTRYINSNVFVLVPTISAEINFTRFFKVNIGAEYRRTFGVTGLEDLRNDNFSNFGVYTNFIFGWF